VKIDNFGQKTRFLRFFVIFSVFFAYFQALISGENIDQNTTCYSVLEMAECEQQYYGQFVVVNSTCQKLLIKNQTEGPGLKIDRFQSTISNS
jgi:hypothetical protein